MAAALDAGAWTHLAVAVDGAGVTFFTNGVQAGAALPLSYARSNQGYLLIGTTADTNAVDPALNGEIDELRVYGAALSGSEIAGMLEALEDADSDGLSNLEEYVNDTDPAVDDAAADSDGDGFTNYEEINTHGTDPHSADSDGDGETDGCELNTLGTNPLVADQGSDPAGPALDVVSPSQGERILW